VVRDNGELWSRVVAFENLHLAYRRAARGKRFRPAVAAFEFELERNLIELQAELRGGAYTSDWPQAWA